MSHPVVSNAQTWVGLRVTDPNGIDVGTVSQIYVNETTNRPQWIAVKSPETGPTTDDAMTRSEERVNVGTRTTESGRARLRKYVVTEQVTQTVPVSHEEVRIEREPITDANREAAMSGAEISEEEHEVVLHEEVPVVEKEVVPVERVRLAKEAVTGEETINEEVRKEQIEEEGAGKKKRDR